MQIRFLAAAAAPLAVGASLALAACGGSTPSTAATSSPQDAELKFARCMRAHGINVPDPTGSGPLKINITNQQAFDAAQKACDRYRTASQQKLTPAQRAAFQDKALQFARCMRAHGVNVSDPQTTGGGVRIGIQDRAGGPGGGDSPAFQAAQNACGSLNPKKPGGGGGFGLDVTSGPEPSGSRK